jgi:hypothetical protein
MTKIKAQISNECQMTNAKIDVTVQGFKVDGFVKSRHSGENRSPETL